MFTFNLSLQAQVRQQGEYESLRRSLNIGFGTWEFSPLDLENPFQTNEGSVHLWQGDEDLLVPVTLHKTFHGFTITSFQVLVTCSPMLTA